MATVLLAALLGGCSFLSKEADTTEVSSKAETESPGATQESETETAETEETQESHEAAEDEESGEEETEDHFVEKKIVVATDMHYFAEKLAGNRCDSFVGMARGGDGRVLEYGWEVMDAFLDDMKEEDPDLLILSGDLTLDGEKASHEELAELLEGLSEAGIEVAVIPGNHDINNPDARRYTADGAEKVESITADEFRDIYADFGYVAADSRDPASLSYLYKIDSANWVLMLDSCQYDWEDIDQCNQNSRTEYVKQQVQNCRSLSVSVCSQTCKQVWCNRTNCRTNYQVNSYVVAKQSLNGKRLKNNG